MALFCLRLLYIDSLEWILAADCGEESIGSKIFFVCFNHGAGLIVGTGDRTARTGDFRLFPLEEDNIISVYIELLPQTPLEPSLYRSELSSSACNDTNGFRTHAEVQTFLGLYT